MFDLNTRTGWSSGSGQDGQVVRQLASLPLGPGFKPSPGTTGICPQTLPGLSNTFPINFHFRFTVLISHHTLLFFQIPMNVQQTPIIVMLMPLAVIHLAHSSVNVNLVSLEMEPLVEVIYIAYSYSRKSISTYYCQKDPEKGAKHIQVTNFLYSICPFVISLCQYN